MQVFMLTYPESPRAYGERYQRLVGQGYPVEIVMGWDGSQFIGGPLGELVRVNGDSLNIFEICLMLGHMKIWNHIMDAQINECLVLEDDAITELKFDGFLGLMGQARQEVGDTYDAFQLENRANGGYSEFSETLYRSQPCGFGTSAYVLSQNGAERLLNQRTFKQSDLHLMELSMKGGVYNFKSPPFIHDWQHGSLVQRPGLK